MAKQGVAIELFYSGVWNDVEHMVYSRDPIVITRGRESETSSAPPAQATLTFYSAFLDILTDPSNALYGLVGRYTPLRITVGSSIRFAGEIASLTPRWAVKGPGWVDVVVAGVSRRLRQGIDPLDSPVRREALDTNTDVSRVAYWPLEDESGAGWFASAIPHVPAARKRGDVTPASYEGFGGSLPLPVLGNDGRIYGDVPRHAVGAEYARLLVAVPAAGMTDQSAVFQIRCRGGTVSLFEVTYGSASGTLELRALSDTGTVLATSTPIGFDVDGTQFMLTVELEQDGADIDWLVFARKITLEGALDDGGVASGTFAGLTLGESMRIGVNETGGMNGAAVGHMMIGTDQELVFFLGDAMAGWRGETGAHRFQRLADELGVMRVGALDPDDSVPMGLQRAGTITDLLSEIESTDGGLIFDTRHLVALTIRTGRSIYNADPVLELTYGVDVAPPLEPVIDDRATRNDATASRPGGGAARAVLESGPMSVQSPPDGIGRVTTTVSVNPQSDLDLGKHAQWHLLQGTLEGARYPQVTVDLTSAGVDLTADTSAVDLGDIITIANLEADTVRLLVTGYTETIGSHSRRVTFNCERAEPYRIADPVGEVNNRVGFSSLWRRSGTITTTQTSITLRNEEGPDIVFESAFDIVMAGERMTVTAIGAWSGTYPARSAVFTVTRSVNGVVKAHANDSRARMAEPNYIGL